MALNLQQKKELVAELAEVAGQAHSLVAAEYAGLTVAQMTDLRRKARDGGVFLKVSKNTLVRRAVENTDFACVADALTGPMLYAFSKQDPGAAGRLINTPPAPVIVSRRLLGWRRRAITCAHSAARPTNGVSAAGKLCSARGAASLWACSKAG